MPLVSVGGVHARSTLAANPLPLRDSTIPGTAEVKDDQHVGAGGPGFWYSYLFMVFTQY